MEYAKLIFNFFIENPWNILFLVLAIISIIFALNSRKSRKPTYNIRTINLIKDNIKKIKSVDIMYQGEKIENLSISRIAIWNAGKETISSSDVAKNDKFRIVLDEEDKILDFEIIYQKNSANDFHLNKSNDTTLDIDFDYFDYGEGIIVQIYHTTIDNPLIYLIGSIKAAKEIKRINYNSSSNLFIKKNSEISPEYHRYIKSYIPMVIAISLILVLIMDEINFITIPWLKIITQVFIFLIAAFSFWISINVLKSPVPFGFDDFEKEF